MVRGGLGAFGVKGHCPGTLVRQSLKLSARGETRLDDTALYYAALYYKILYFTIL